MKKEKQEPATPVTNTTEVATALGLTESAVRHRAAKAGWSSIGRVCPGGAVYDLTTLPEAIQVAIRLRRLREHIDALPQGRYSRYVELYDELTKRGYTIGKPSLRMYGARWLRRLAAWLDGGQS